MNSNVSTPPKVQLCALPTALHPLARVSEDLQIDLWIKRDDLTGFGGGGNKGRKLEYLLPQILASGADTVVTCGATQSNFVRQLAATCATQNLRCVAAQMDLPYELPPGPIETPDGDKPSQGGNLLYDPYFPLERHIFPNGTWDDLDRHRDYVAGQEREKGHKVFVVKLGGGSPEGVYGFYEAGQELLKQNPEIDQVILASSSGSTQVGLAHALLNSKTKLIGIACDPEPEMPHDLAALSQEFVAKYPVTPALKPKDFDFRLDWVGPGYGVPSEKGTDAIHYLAKREGILLDPVYSGKAFSALLDLARRGDLTGRTVFWHTGGAPALFTL